MASRGSITSTAAVIANKVARLFVRRRNRLICKEAEPGLELGTGPPSWAGDAPDQQPRQRVNDQRHQEQREPYLDKCCQMKVSRRFAKFVGNYAGHGIA